MNKRVYTIFALGSISAVTVTLWIFPLVKDRDKEPAIVSRTVIEKTEVRQDHGELLDSNLPREREVPSESKFKEAWKRAHPAYQRYHELAEKVLPSLHDKVERERYLSDRSLINFTKTILNQSEERDFSMEKMDQRMLAVSFLDQALAWKDNPQRDVVLGTVRDILSEPFTDSPDIKTLPEKLRKSKAGDRIELFQLLLVHDRKAALALSEQASDPVNRRIFEVAFNMLTEPLRDKKNAKR